MKQVLHTSFAVGILMLAASFADANDVNVIHNRYGDVYLEGNAAVNDVEILHISANAYQITGKNGTRIGNGLPGRLRRSFQSMTIVAKGTLYVRTYGGNDRIKLTANKLAGRATNHRIDILPGDGHDDVDVFRMNISALNVVEDEDSVGNDEIRVSNVTSDFLSIEAGMGSQDEIHVTDSDIYELDAVGQGDTYFAISRNDIYRSFIWGGYECSNEANIIANDFVRCSAYFGQGDDEVVVVGNHFGGGVYNSIVLRRGDDDLWFQHNTYGWSVGILLEGGEGVDFGNIDRGLVPLTTVIEIDGFERGNR